METARRWAASPGWQSQRRAGTITAGLAAVVVPVAIAVRLARLAVLGGFPTS